MSPCETHRFVREWVMGFAIAHRRRAYTRLGLNPSYALLVALFSAAPVLAVAQDNYPNRPIRMIVPLSAGGSADVIPRIVAEKLTHRFGHPVIVENRPGATGGVGAETVFKAEPDGYTVLATTPPVLVINESLYRKINYDPRAFVPVSIVSALSNVLVVSNKTPFSTVEGLIAFAKAHPDKLNYASPGVGASQHLAMEWLKTLTGIRLTHVPYNGTGPALNDVIAGHVDLMFAGTVSVLPLIAGGRLRAIAVDSEMRIVELPDVPAVAETFPGYVVTSWNAVVAPPKTDARLVATLSAAIAEVVRMPDVNKRLREMSAIPIGSSPADAATRIAQERERWHKIIASAGIKAQ
jgi:tripartite-type tricarboxylate transporter receptor subunit TctC